MSWRPRSFRPCPCRQGCGDRCHARRSSGIGKFWVESENHSRHPPPAQPHSHDPHPFRPHAPSKVKTGKSAQPAEPRLSRTRRRRSSKSPAGKPRCAASSAASSTSTWKTWGTIQCSQTSACTTPPAAAAIAWRSEAVPWARTSATAPTSRPTIWASANTSSSRSPGLRRSAAARRRWRAASSPRTAKSGSTTRARVRSIFVPVRAARQPCRHEPSNCSMRRPAGPCIEIGGVGSMH